MVPGRYTRRNGHAGKRPVAFDATRRARGRGAAARSGLWRWYRGPSSKRMGVLERQTGTRGRARPPGSRRSPSNARVQPSQLPTRRAASAARSFPMRWPGSWGAIRLTGSRSTPDTLITPMRYTFTRYGRSTGR